MTPDDTAFSRYPDQDGWKFVCYTIDDDIMLQMISNIYDLDNIQTLNKNFLRILLPTPITQNLNSFLIHVLPL